MFKDNAIGTKMLAAKCMPCWHMPLCVNAHQVHVWQTLLNNPRQHKVNINLDYGFGCPNDN